MNNARLLLRAAGRDPLAYIGMVSSLAIAIGANTAILGVGKSLLLTPVPLVDISRFVYLDGLAEPPVGDAVAWWSQLSGLEHLGRFGTGYVPFDSAEVSDRVRVTSVSGRFFSLFNTRPYLGRTFTNDDDKPGHHRVMIASHGFWVSYLGESLSAIGMQVRFRGIPYTIVGVMPAGFVFPSSSQVWTPWASFTELALTSTTPTASRRRTSGWVGKLKDGRSIWQVRAEATTLLSNMNRSFSPTSQVNYGEIVSVMPLLDFMVRNVRPFMRLIALGGFFVFLLGVINASTLLLGRFLSRQKEAAIRVALGAARGQLFRQIMIEPILISSFAGILGFLIAVWSVKLLRWSAFQDYVVLPPQSASFDYSLLLACVGVSTFAGILTGLAPAISIGRCNANHLLLDRTGKVTGQSARLIRRAFITAEVALAGTLLTTAHLSWRSLANLTSRNPGFFAEGLLTAEADFSRLRENQRLQNQRELLRAIEESFGVEVAATTTRLPLVNDARSMLYLWHRNFSTAAEYYLVSGGYFDTMKIPLTHGRSFVESDQHVMIINAKLAEALWPGQNAVGQHLRLDGETVLREVIGVAGDVMELGIRDHLPLQIYLPHTNPFRSFAPPFVGIVIRCGRNCSVVESKMREQSTFISGTAALYNWASYQNLVSKPLIPLKLRTAIVSVCAMFGLLIACVGVFALVSYVALSRSFELGVHAAFGANARDIFWMVMYEGLSYGALGIVIGGCLTLWLGELIKNIVFGMEPFEPGSYAISAVIVMVSVLMGSILPSLRATRQEPWRMLQKA
ncbi:MAG: ABC transporter permease [Acidobacteriota bacterium]